jgi:hyperosmotically inducible protein
MSILHRTAFALLLAGALAACSDSNKTAGQKLDAVVANTESKAAEAKADAKAGGAEVKDAMKETATNVKQAVADATIVTAINAELAKDSALSALKINVDSRDGAVTLNGTAPDEAAKVHATQLATSVTGVKSVDNRLTTR